MVALICAARSLSLVIQYTLVSSALCRDMGTDDDNVDDSRLPSEPDQCHYNWKDITEEFNVACDDLKLGELMHDAQ